jgi:hypothetical protein
MYLPQNPAVCFPLGPLQDRMWRAEEATMPEIPLAEVVDMTQMMAGEKKKGKEGEAAKEDQPEEGVARPQPKKRPACGFCSRRSPAVAPQ